jgi:hypothetical protein
MPYYGKKAEWTAFQSEFLLAMSYLDQPAEEIAEMVADLPLFDNKNRCKDKIDSIKQHINMHRSQRKQAF